MIAGQIHKNKTKMYQLFTLQVRDSNINGNINSNVCTSVFHTIQSSAVIRRFNFAIFLIYLKMTTSCIFTMLKTFPWNFWSMHFVFFMIPMNHSGNNTETIGEGRSR